MRFMRRVFIWAWLTLILTLLTILAGGIVRTTHSGMGCPDWPKCFGLWIPPMYESQLPLDFEKYLRKQDIDHSFNAFHTWIEYINRLIAALLGVFGIIQLAVARFTKGIDRSVKRWALYFLIIVIVVGLFGALVVRFNLQHYSISVHMTLAFLLVLIQVSLLSKLYKKYALVPVSSMLYKTLFILLGVIIVQTALGTGVRMYVDDVSKLLLYTQREKWLAQMPAIFLVHRTFSWVVVAGCIFLVWLAVKQRVLWGPVLLFVVLVLSSIIIGITMVYASIPAWAQPIHVTLSACIMGQLFYMISICKKN
jgi:heme a synthase